MKTLNLENLGVQELDAMEMKEVDGEVGGGKASFLSTFLKKNSG
ncbi:hypothetical protein [Pedobacter nanyangensis]|nr:hypothetical protein [Pedobacter nanyangensis]